MFFSGVRIEKETKHDETKLIFLGPIHVNDGISGFHSPKNETGLDALWLLSEKGFLWQGKGPLFLSEFSIFRFNQSISP